MPSFLLSRLKPSTLLQLVRKAVHVFETTLKIVLNLCIPLFLILSLLGIGTFLLVRL